MVGEALAFLMDVRIERGEIPEDEAYELLDAWAKERGDRLAERNRPSCEELLVSRRR